LQGKGERGREMVPSRFLGVELIAGRGPLYENWRSMLNSMSCGKCVNVNGWYLQDNLNLLCHCLRLEAGQGIYNELARE
jgi:hypothetical protein